MKKPRVLRAQIARRLLRANGILVEESLKQFLSGLLRLLHEMGHGDNVGRACVEMTFKNLVCSNPLAGTNR